MLRPLLLSLAITTTLAGCVTTMTIAREDRITLPVLLGLVAADVIVGSVAIAQLDSMSTAGAIASGVALTGVDLGIGCVLGGCGALRP